MLRSVFNYRTKAVLSTTRSTPAVVYPREDLELLARFCQEFDTIAICDEVWEHVIFDGREHIPLIAIPGMRDPPSRSARRQDFFADGRKIRFCLSAPPYVARAAKVPPVSHLTTGAKSSGRGRYGLGKPAEGSSRCARSWRGAGTA